MKNSNLKINLGEYRFRPFVAGTIPGTLIPIIVRPILEANLNLTGDISQTDTSVSQEASLTAGLSYENGNWNIIKNLSNDFSFSFPSAPEILDFKAGVGPTLNLILYDIAGPYGRIDEYLRFTLEESQSSWSLYGGLEALLGVKMQIFSWNVTDYFSRVIDYEKLLVEEGVSEPSPETTLITIQPGPEEGKDAYVEYILWPEGSGESYYGYDTDILKIYQEFKGTHGTIEESLIEFPLFSIPMNSNIVFAKLKLYGYGSSNYIGVDPTFKIKEIISPWNESTVKWNTKPLYGEYVASCILPEDEKKWHEWDITSLVQKWVNGEPNYGLVLLTTGNEVIGKFNSSDYLDDPSKRPMLVVSYY